MRTGSAREAAQSFSGSPLTVSDRDGGRIPLAIMTREWKIPLR
jgi:hypothetical protein